MSNRGQVTLLDRPHRSVSLGADSFEKHQLVSVTLAISAPEAAGEAGLVSLSLSAVISPLLSVEPTIFLPGPLDFNYANNNPLRAHWAGEHCLLTATGRVGGQPILFQLHPHLRGRSLRLSGSLWCEAIPSHGQPTSLHALGFRGVFFFVVFSHSAEPVITMDPFCCRDGKLIST